MQSPWTALQGNLRRTVRQRSPSLRPTPQPPSRTIPTRKRQSAYIPKPLRKVSPIGPITPKCAAPES
ncbi:hypothetical protein BDY19DRAFT_966623 [Irpex rosettiformis]|uniref:Uncharacterized protein n=1 Tax=Irpex rosettiformis TaxID=378272 RepID=A0ACB8TTK0_9APHY|nr:hypothetical protein BDY19DRAFT_966623 [Irpex rosettiformis]